MKRFLNPKALILLDQAVFSGSSFLLTLFVARSLDLPSFGQYSAYILGIYLLVSILGAFVIQPFQVLLAQNKQPQQYITFAFWFQLLTSLVFLGFTAIATVVLQEPLVQTVFPFAMGFMMHDFGRKMLLALNRPKQTLLLDFCAAVAAIVAVGLFIANAQQGISLLLRNLAIAYAAPGFLLLVLLQPGRVAWQTSRSMLALHFTSGRWLFLTALSQWWSGNLFVVASGLYLGAPALAALRLAQSLLGVLNILLQTFENYVLPQTAHLANQSHSAALSYLSSITKRTSLLFIPVLLLAFVFANPIMVLAGGSAYAAYGYVLQSMAILYVFVFMNQPIRIVIRVMSMNQHFFVGYLLTLVFSMACAPYLLSTYGLNGAVLGLTVAQLLLGIYWLLVLERKHIQLWKSFTSF